MATTNDYAVKGLQQAGGTGQWLPPFSLVDYLGNSCFSVSSAGVVAMPGGASGAGYLDLSGIAAAGPALKITATSGTPTVTWSSSSGTTINSTAPQGYIQVNDGSGTAGYIPYWR